MTTCQQLHQFIVSLLFLKWQLPVIVLFLTNDCQLLKPGKYQQQ